MIIIKSKIIRMLFATICSTMMFVNTGLGLDAICADTIAQLTTDALLEEEAELSTPRDYIYKYCDEYGIDPSLAIAISRLETGNWTSPIFNAHYNYGGLCGAGGYFHYSDLDEGAERFVSLLAWYRESGFSTPEAIGKKYCPANAIGWAKKVKAIMEEENHNYL